MTRWGLILLVAFLVFGLGKTSPSKTTTLAVGLTSLVIGFVMLKTVR